jgi:hypothetical protein
VAPASGTAFVATGRGREHLDSPGIELLAKSRLAICQVRLNDPAELIGGTLNKGNSYGTRNFALDAGRANSCNSAAGHVFTPLTVATWRSDEGWLIAPGPAAVELSCAPSSPGIAASGRLQLEFPRL